MRRQAVLIVLLLSVFPALAEDHYQATGLVLDVDPEQRTVVISHDPIPGFMDAMVMPFRVLEPEDLDNVRPATMVDFTLTVDDTSSYVSAIQERKFDSIEQDPEQARRLSALDAALKAQAGAPPPLQIGQAVPDFTLVDQQNRPVTLSEFRGKVVAMTFIYTRCPLPDYCFRLTNNFGRLQKRFEDRVGKDLILLSVSFDPDHDTPEVLAEYADVWNANTSGWHFLTGSLEEIKQVCDRFGMNFWPSEGLMTHSLHTVLINPDGTLAANLEGNRFTAVQLGDLVQTMLTGNAREVRSERRSKGLGR